MPTNKEIITAIFAETVIRMKDGKMAAIEEYCDTELVASALGERI
jgi:ketosteroid isomerase-like protein